jgi:hypothetical protein
LIAWAKVARLDPERSTLGGCRARDQIDALNKSRECDPSGLTTFMMLRGLLDQYLADEVHVLRQGPDRAPGEGHRADAADQGAPRRPGDSPRSSRSSTPSSKRILDAAAHYGVKPATAWRSPSQGPARRQVQPAGFIRRDALRSIETLEAHQFTQGKGDPAPLQINRKVFEFWNINSILRAMQAQDFPGISMCLIRDPMVLESFFVFAVRNGDTLTVLTDRENRDHPAQARMSRRPDRTLSGALSGTGSRTTCSIWCPRRTARRCTRSSGRRSCAPTSSACR